MTPSRLGDRYLPCLKVVPSPVQTTQTFIQIYSIFDTLTTTESWHSSPIQLEVILVPHNCNWIDWYSNILKGTDKNLVVFVFILTLKVVQLVVWIFPVFGWCSLMFFFWDTNNKNQLKLPFLAKTRTLKLLSLFRAVTNKLRATTKYLQSKLDSPIFFYILNSVYCLLNVATYMCCEQWIV